MKNEELQKFEEAYFESPWIRKNRPYNHFFIYAALKLNKDFLKWLDIGCAYGSLIKEARAFQSIKGRKIRIEAFGIDLSKYALERSGMRSWLVRGDAQNLPFKEDSFDVISAFDLVEHFA